MADISDTTTPAAPEEQLLGRSPDPELDDIVAFTAALCATEIAGLSLAGRTRLWFNGSVCLDGDGHSDGFGDGDGDGGGAARRGASLCGHVVEHRELLEVADLAGDARFADSPFAARGSGIGFFAGAPLLDGPVALGTLFVIAERPRRLSELQRMGLESMARQVVAQLRLRRAAETAREAGQRLAEAQRVAKVGSWEWDVPRDTLRWSDQLYQLFGLEPGRLDATYEGYLDAVHPDDRAMITAAIGEAFASGGEFGFDHRVLWPDGTIRWLQSRGRLERAADGTPLRMHGTAADITERVELQEELAALALVDELTGLRNRRGFLTLADQQLKVAARAGRPLQLVFIDIDAMKTINDTYGHAEGDRTLVTVGGLLRDTFRSSDIVARVGGDEFCVLVVDDGGIGDANLEPRIAALRSIAARPGQPYQLSLSLGLARVEANSTVSVEDLLGRADGAMYQDKASPRRRP
ncbi:MAG: diguanylate cyclase, partial [Acidimicrobiales bacterium]